MTTARKQLEAHRALVATAKERAAIEAVRKAVINKLDELQQAATDCGCAYLAAAADVVNAVCNKEYGKRVASCKLTPTKESHGKR